MRPYDIHDPSIKKSRQKTLRHLYPQGRTLGLIDKILEQPVSAIMIADDFASGSGLYKSEHMERLREITKSISPVFLIDCDAELVHILYFEY